jgi:hypothetical protein
VGNEPFDCATLADRFQLVSRLINTDAMRGRNVGRCFGQKTFPGKIPCAVRIFCCVVEDYLESRSGTLRISAMAQIACPAHERSHGRSHAELHDRSHHGRDLLARSHLCSKGVAKSCHG